MVATSFATSCLSHKNTCAMQPFRFPANVDPSACRLPMTCMAASALLDSYEPSAATVWSVARWRRNQTLVGSQRNSGMICAAPSTYISDHNLPTALVVKEPPSLSASSRNSSIPLFGCSVGWSNFAHMETLVNSIFGSDITPLSPSNSTQYLAAAGGTWGEGTRETGYHPAPSGASWVHEIVPKSVISVAVSAVSALSLLKRVIPEPSSIG
mmetsp:Transcript_5238/g.9093  ORF Transcript_5238/g.9093 Transcript_5238/m.9093 type:complete len:211 (+) Transcript_5238:162-794(+)